MDKYEMIGVQRAAWRGVESAGGFIDADRCDRILSFQDLSRSTRFAYVEPALPKILFGDSVGMLALCANVLDPNR